MAAHVEVAGTLQVASPPADAFWFFTPEGERLWVPDWVPEYLHPADGALVDGLTFRTRHGGEVTLWLVSRRDPVHGAIDYVRVTPESRIGTVSVRLTQSGTAATAVSIVYRLTSLSAAGDRKLQAFADEFQELIASWERAIGALLARGA